MSAKLFVCINAGLGNQVFQYLVSRALAEDTKRQLIIDTSYYRKIFHPSKKQGYYYPFLLSSFCQIMSRTNIFQQLFIGLLKKSNKLQNLLNTLATGIFNRIDKFPIVLNDDNFSMVEAFPDKDVIMIGFFQSQPIVEKNNGLGLEKQFKLSSKAVLLRDQIKANFSISVHIRRGDYITESGITPYYATLTTRYYTSAIDQIDTIINTEPKKIYVFSDEPEWVRENINFRYPTTYVGDCVTDEEQFYLQSICDVNVTANSTFSYIPALLNANANKVVLAPSQWFHKIENDNKIFIPATWIRLKN